MKLHFDPNQQFQLDAVRAVTDLFDGQPRGTLEFSVIRLASADAQSLYSSVSQSDLGAGNQIGIDDATTSTSTNSPRTSSRPGRSSTPPQQHTILPALLRRDGDRHRQDLRLPLAHIESHRTPQFLPDRAVHPPRKNERPNALKKQVVASPECLALWEQIKPRTTYRVEFDTGELIARVVRAIKIHMPRIDKPRIHYKAGAVRVGRGGVEGDLVGASTEEIDLSNRPIPDVLAYLQNETELTRSTIYRILKECERLDEFFNNPQRFLDEAAKLMKNVLHDLLVEGTKYEKLTGPGAAFEWEQLLIRDQEVVNYLSLIKVEKSVHEYVEYDSEVERAFAEQLDKMDAVKLFLKLPRGFLIDTPVGQYNPDWAILKHDGTALYLVRETKSTKDFLKYRNTERDKVVCGKEHFKAIGVSFDVVTSAGEI